MRPHAQWALSFVLAFSMLLMPVAVTAGPPGSLASFNRAQHQIRPGAGGVLSIKPRICLEPVTAMELTGGESQQALSEGKFNFGGGTFHSLKLLTSVSRSVPELWRMRVPLDTRIFALDVNYELVGANGRSSCLGSLERNDSEIKVVIDEIPPRIIGRDNHSMVIEGGMVMHLQLDSARTAGSYSGTLTVVVNRF